MNRQLKFRVWDKLEKRLIYPDKGYQGHFVLDLNGRFHNLQNGSGGDEYIIQQFTGIKDKNEKDIYEGDIVKFLYTDSEFIFQVIWDDFYSGFAFAVGDGKGLNHTGFKFTNNIWCGNDNYEMIGNIFENPELLEKL